MNNSRYKSIRMTPVETLIGCETWATAEKHILNEIKEEMRRLDLRKAKKDILNQITKTQVRQREYYDISRKETRKYSEINMVLVKIIREKATGSSRKLFPKYKAPFRVHKVLFNDRYELKDMHIWMHHKKFYYDIPLTLSKQMKLSFVDHNYWWSNRIKWSSFI